MQQNGRFFKICHYNTSCGKQYPVRTTWHNGEVVFIAQDVAYVVGARFGAQLCQRRAVKPHSTHVLVGDAQYWAMNVHGLRLAVQQQMTWVALASARKPFSCNCGCAKSVKHYNSEMTRFMVWASRVAASSRKRQDEPELHPHTASADRARSGKAGSETSGHAFPALVLPMSAGTLAAWENVLDEEFRRNLRDVIEVVILEVAAKRLIDQAQASSKRSARGDATRKLRELLDFS